MAIDKSEYAGIAEATRDVRTKVSNSEIINHPLSSPTFSVVIPEWTKALSGFEARATITPQEAVRIDQISALYDTQSKWLTEKSRQLNIGTINELDSDKVLFMGLFRDVQIRYASKQNLNPHKLTVLLDEHYNISE